MVFFLSMTVFALSLIFFLWLIFRSGKFQPRKKIKQTTKKIPRREKTPGISPLKSASDFPSGEQLRKNATELLKKNPEVVSRVIRKWLREK